MALTAYMAVKGKNQGDIKGSCPQGGDKKDKILLYASDHLVEIPKDTHTGLPTGQRIHHAYEVMKAVANAYERRGKALVRWGERAKGRKDFVRHLNSEIESNAMSEDVAKKALAEYDDKTVNAYEKMKEAVRRMILVHKEALSHAQTFLRGHTWDSPQVMNGYDDDPSGSVAQYRSWLGGAMDLMNQKLKDLNKDIKEIEQGDDDDEDN